MNKAWPHTLEKEELKEIREEVLVRDKCRCAFSGCAEKMRPDIHHILGNPRRSSLHNELRNLISLCRVHHTWAETLPVEKGVMVRFLREILQKKYGYEYEDWYSKGDRKRDLEILSRFPPAP